MKHAFPKRCLLACALALAAALAGCASTSPAEQQIQLEQCQQTTFKATLHPGYVVPPTNSAARGELVAEFNRFTGLLSFCVQFEGLSGPVLAANFHSPAMEGEEAAPTLSIGRMFVSPYEGRAILSPRQSANLLSGQWYLELRTERYPGGELRGQLIEQTLCAP